MKKSDLSVLSLYKAINPSLRDIEGDDDLFKKLMAQRFLLFRRLGIPRSYFKDKRLVSFGCGTGETDLFYVLQGISEYWAVDMNVEALTRTKDLFQKYRPKLKIQGCDSAVSIETINVDSFPKFDVGVADGSLVHSDDLVGNLKLLGELVDQTGILIIGQAESSGMFQRNLQRMLFDDYVADKDAFEVALELFSDHIHASVNSGLRTAKQVISDTYLNPTITTVSYVEILQIMQSIGFEVIGMFPRPATLGGLSFREMPSDHENMDSFGNLMSLSLSSMLGFRVKCPNPHFADCFSSLLSLSHSSDELYANIGLVSNLIESLLAEAAYDDAGDRRIYKFFEEVAKLLEYIGTDYEDWPTLLSSFEYLFADTCGVGHMYMVFERLGNSNEIR